MKSSHSFGIVGATGAVGQKFLTVLAEHRIKPSVIRLFASERSKGQKIVFDGNPLTVEAVEGADFSGLDVVFFSAGTDVSQNLCPKVVAAGAVVIDNSNAFRMDDSVPLVVPEVNPQALKRHRGLIANPNCSTAQMVVALKPLHDRATIKRVVVSTYQSVSGSGKEAMDELWNQTKGMYVPGQEVAPSVYPKQIAFNVIPHIDVFLDDGSTKEEWKMVAETKKIVDKAIKVTATCVRVPVFVGHAEAINIEFEDFLDEDEAREILRAAPGILVVDKREDGGYVTPVDCVGDYATFISRIRQDGTIDNGLNLWCVSDNLRKGAALNAVQIAETLGKRVLKKG